MRIGQDAMNAALGDLRGLRWSTKFVSLYESFLVAKWFERQERYPGPSVEDANQAVAELFVFDPSHANGRLSAFRYDWKLVDASGRKTVWNNTTRSPTVATSIFVDGDIRNGLRPDATTVMRQHLQDLELPSAQALACLVLRDQDFPPTARWDEALGLLRSSLGLDEVDLSRITAQRVLGPRLLLSGTEWSIAGLPESLAPPSLVAVASRSAAGESGDDIIVNSRTARMLRTAVRSFASVLLVGPPGTGKGSLVRWLAEEVRINPVSFGFPEGTDPNPMWRTPDESWSAFEMIGGLAPKDGELAWSNGLLLNSLAEQRWLVLDETNRADMDKIMGPLLTWLAEQEVEIGRTAAHGGHPIMLGWSREATSAATDPSGVGEPTTFVAGTNWRLLGTYNPQDAQRVFRFGQALSRRFTTVPVPALSPGEFESLLVSRFPGLGDDAKASIVGLYSAHHVSAETVLGPAVFLRMGSYLKNADPTQSTEELIAEAYVLSLGKYISSFDDSDFDNLGRRVLDEDAGLSKAQWDWVEEQREILG